MFLDAQAVKTPEILQRRRGILKSFENLSDRKRVNTIKTFCNNVLQRCCTPNEAGTLLEVCNIYVCLALGLLF
jgi:hypothetical protein